MVAGGLARGVLALPAARGVLVLPAGLPPAGRADGFPPVRELPPSLLLCPASLRADIGRFAVVRGVDLACFDAAPPGSAAAAGALAAATGALAAAVALAAAGVLTF